MKLGDHTIGVRSTGPREVDGVPVTDEYGAPVLDTVDRVVDWCLVTPSTRDSDSQESQDRTGPTMSGMALLAPPDAVLVEGDVVVWPITGATVDGVAVTPPVTADNTGGGVLSLSGQEWQVDGEPQPWDEALEARLRKAT